MDPRKNPPSVPIYWLDEDDRKAVSEAKYACAAGLDLLQYAHNPNAQPEGFVSCLLRLLNASQAARDSGKNVWEIFVRAHREIERKLPDIEGCAGACCALDLVIRFAYAILDGAMIRKPNEIGGKMVTDPQQPEVSTAMEQVRKMSLPQLSVKDFHDLLDDEAGKVGMLRKGIHTDPDLQRQFMKIAIAEARKCEPIDERVHPRVGAVVVKDGNVLAVAYRGEQEHGEHAEFTALQKKLPNAALAGATVYTTLEPCTSRNPPKLSCADRLIERRVKRVVIGMPDPNRTVYGEGWARLREASIETVNFDEDLKKEIEEMNREFIRHHKNAVHTSSEPSISKQNHIDGKITSFPLSNKCYQLLELLANPDKPVQIQDIPESLAGDPVIVCEHRGYVECFNPLLEDADKRARAKGYYPTKDIPAPIPTHIRITKKGQACLAEYRLNNETPNCGG